MVNYQNRGSILHHFLGMCGAVNPHVIVEADPQSDHDQCCLVNSQMVGEGIVFGHGSWWILVTDIIGDLRWWIGTSTVKMHNYKMILGWILFLQDMGRIGEFLPSKWPQISRMIMGIHGLTYMTAINEIKASSKRAVFFHDGMVGFQIFVQHFVHS